MTVRNARIARFEPAPPEGNQGTVSVPWFPVFFLKPGAFLVEGVTRFPTVRLSTASVLFQLLPKFLMDYVAGWGNRTNRDGTAPPVPNIHLWGEKRFLTPFPLRVKCGLLNSLDEFVGSPCGANFV